MYLETLAPATKKLLDKMSKCAWLKDYYLAGGTALALQYGHRQSIDLDWFTVKNFSTKTLLTKLSKLGKFELLNEEENTIEGYVDGVKLSFMAYQYPLLEKKLNFINKVCLASPLDIALMKITAISGRNAKKDFIDLYWYLHVENTTLLSLLAKMKKKFSGIKYDEMHIYKSLVYFKEPDTQPMPVMLQKISWGKIKSYFLDEVKKVL